MIRIMLNIHRSHFLVAYYVGTVPNDSFCDKHQNNEKKRNTDRQKYTHLHTDTHTNTL